MSREGEAMSDWVLAGWCEKHEDFAWRYSDGSSACFYACIIESGSSECVVIPAVLTVRGRRKRVR